MEWEKCMGLECSLTKNDSKEIRHTSLIDIDKIVFSSKFRTLQDKTQVYPLSKGNVVRTRLTHSLEVSSVGRSLGYLIGKHVLQKQETSKEFKEHISANDFANHVSAACMIHDIGNPPFGHAGEDAIQDFFSNFFSDKNNKKGLSKKEEEDFLKFNGNAEGFLLTAGKYQSGKLSVSNPTLGAFIKYPCLSTQNKTYGNKYCIMQKTAKEYEEVVKSLGIKEIESGVWARHPLVFLTEAADDICYCVADIEDGIILGDLRYDIAEESLLSIASKDSHFNYQDFKNRDTLQAKLSYLRGRIINYLIFELRDIFATYEKQILNGNLVNKDGCYTPLLDLLNKEDKQAVQNYKAIAKEYLFKKSDKLELEIQGQQAINLIIEKLINALQNKNDRKSQLIISYTEHKNFYNLDINEDKYNTLLEITSYISLLTDHNLMKVAGKMNKH